MHRLASELRDPPPSLGPIRLMPMALSMARLAECAADEAIAKQGARAMIIKAFEFDFAGYADLLRQAMDMRAQLLENRGVEAEHIDLLPHLRHYHERAHVHRLP